MLRYWYYGCMLYFAKSALVLRYYADNAVPTAICEPWGEARKSQRGRESPGEGQERGQARSARELPEAGRGKARPVNRAQALK